MARTGKSHRSAYPPGTPGPNAPKQAIPARGETASVFANVSTAAQAMVRRAWVSPDKTVFLSRVTDDRVMMEAVDAGYLAPLARQCEIWRITAKGEAYMAALMRAM